MGLDIDCRLLWLWRAVWAGPELDLQVVAAYLRFAYGSGYADALTEEVRGKLYRDHYYNVPMRKKRRARPG